MHLLNNLSSKVNFIQEVYNRGKKEYIRKTNRIDQIVTRDLAWQRVLLWLHFKRKEKKILIFLCHSGKINQHQLCRKPLLVYTMNIVCLFCLMPPNPDLINFL